MRLATVLAVLAVAAPAAAQSKRYPPEAVDKDKEAADKSKLWDKASNPDRKPYDDLLAQATEHLATKTTDGASEAVKLLDEAIEKLPNVSRGYRMRGEAHTLLKVWSRCADDLAKGVAHLEKTELDARATADLRKKLGICQARAGRLGEAERTLAEAAASGTASGEVWMRLGEVRIAMGKLEEAQAALETAMNTTDVPSPPLVRFLLAGAYDRSRRPSEALRLAQEAVHADRTYTSLRNPNLPLITNGEAEYLMGLANSVPDLARPEYALVYFRRFVQIAPDSPWRKRAEDKIRELQDTRLPEIVHRGSSITNIDTAPGTPAFLAVRKSMPAMRACLAKLPTTVLTVTITKVGPRTPANTTAQPSPRRRSRDLMDPFANRSPYRNITAPPPGVTTTVDNTGIPPEGAEATMAAIRCVEPIAEKIALPAIKERDTYYRISFSVVGR